MSLDAPWIMDQDIHLPVMTTDRETVMVFLGEIEVIEVPQEMVKRWKQGEGGLFCAIALPLERNGRWMRATRLEP